MNDSSGLIVPVVMWGEVAPSHIITSIYLLRDQRTIATGSADGQIVLWNLEIEASCPRPSQDHIDKSEPSKNDENDFVDVMQWKDLTPRHMLIGHQSSAVRVLAKCEMIMKNSSKDLDRDKRPDENGVNDGESSNKLSNNSQISSSYLVSGSDNGEMFVWDVSDGRAVQFKRFPNHVHRCIQSYRKSSTSSTTKSTSTTPSSSNECRTRLFCSGLYSELLVLDGLSLEVLYVLASRVSPNWITSFHVLRPRNRTDDVILGLTKCGVVKVWTLNDETIRSSGGGKISSGSDVNNNEQLSGRRFSSDLGLSKLIFENESKNINCVNAKSLVCCVYNMRTVLIVTTKFWSIYDAGDFTTLLQVTSGSTVWRWMNRNSRSNASKQSIRLLGGEFLSGDRVAIWTEAGETFLFKLPPQCVVGCKEFRQCNNSSSTSTAQNQVTLYGVLDVAPHHDMNNKCSFVPPKIPAFKFLILSSDYLHLTVSPSSSNSSSPESASSVSNYSKTTSSNTFKWVKYVVKGDCHGQLSVWRVPNSSETSSLLLQSQPTYIDPLISNSISNVWKRLRPGVSSGLFNNLLDCDVEKLQNKSSNGRLKEQRNNTIVEEQSMTTEEAVRTDTKKESVTTSIFISHKFLLICGRSDGLIIVIPAIKVIKHHLLSTEKHGTNATSVDPNFIKFLRRHTRKVTCLLYPNGELPRYDPTHLISASADMTVCLWDVFSGTLLHVFEGLHGGTIDRIYITPPLCSLSRLESCVCCIASDSSVSIVSLNEKRAVFTAAAHPLPIVDVRWRTADGYLIVVCLGGSLYIWEIETGNLERVVSGVTSEDILSTCVRSDEGLSNLSSSEKQVLAAFSSSSSGLGGSSGGNGSASLNSTIYENVGSNPARHFFRGIRHRNLAAIKLATQSGIQQLSSGRVGPVTDVEVRDDRRTYPLSIQSFKANSAHDSDAHVIFFDVDALLVELLSEEYAAMSPGTMETQGFTNQTDYQRVVSLTRPPDSSEGGGQTMKKLSGFITKVKDRADVQINTHTSPHTQRRLTGLMSKVKEGADRAKSELEKARVEIEKRASALDTDVVIAGGQSVGGGVDSRRSSARNPSVDSTTSSSTQFDNPLYIDTSLANSNNSSSSSTSFEIAQLLLSLLHAWNLDVDLDSLLSSKVGLIRPVVPVCFGITSSNGERCIMSLPMPSWLSRGCSKSSPAQVLESNSSSSYFTSVRHWQLSNVITTNHLLAIVSITNTLISVSNASFIPEQERRRKLVRQETHGQMLMVLPPSSASSSSSEAQKFTKLQDQIRKCWMLLKTLHCLLIRDKVVERQILLLQSNVSNSSSSNSSSYKDVSIESLALRWQDKSLQIRLAAQELLVSELRSMGEGGRRRQVKRWANYLPKYSEVDVQNHQTAYSMSGAGGQSTAGSASNMSSSSSTHSQQLTANGGGGLDVLPSPRLPVTPSSSTSSSGQSSDSDEAVVERSRKIIVGGVGGRRGGKGSSSSYASLIQREWNGVARRNECTAVIIMGVIGAVFDMESEMMSFPRNGPTSQALDNKLIRMTAQALMFLVLSSPPPLSLKTEETSENHSRKCSNPALKRAAIDLIGRGFTLWEPHLEVSKLLLALLEMCCEAPDWWVPTYKYSLPLTPKGDTCRTARKTLETIVTVRPAVFIACMGRELVRYHNIVINAQALQVNIAWHVLTRSKGEIIHLLQNLLLDATSGQNDSLLRRVQCQVVDVADILIHCVDCTRLREVSIVDLFPSLLHIPMLSHCISSRRVVIGTESGQLMIYQLKSSSSANQPSKSVQVMTSAHKGMISACSFSPDGGKNLATYSATENKVSFWQTSTGIFGLGSAQVRCTKSFNTPVSSMGSGSSGQGHPMLSVNKLIWNSNRTVTLVLSDGKEHRYNA